MKNKPFVFAAIFAGSLAASSSHAQFLRLLGDLNTQPVFSPLISPAPSLGRGGGTVAYFVAADINGFEVWRTDGTPAGTGPLGDLNIGRPTIYGVAGTRVIFDATGMIYSSDAPTQFDELLPPMQPLFNTNPDLWVPSAQRGDRLFFGARPISSQAVQLFSTDGTAEATSALYTAVAGSSAFTSIAATPSRVFATEATSANFNRRLIMMDGMAPASVVRTFVNMDGGSFIPFGWLTPADDSVFFIAPDDTGRQQVWISGGTTQSTVPLTSLSTTVGNNISSLTWNGLSLGNGGRVAFLAPLSPQSGGPAAYLWISDGTVGGTARTDITTQVFSASAQPGPSSASPRTPILSINNEFALIVSQPGMSPPHAVWVGDGTAAGTRALSTSAADPLEFIGLSRGSGEAPDVAYFIASIGSGSPAQALWRTDGTQAGTYALPSPQGALGLSSIRPLSYLNQSLIFTVQQTLVPPVWSVWITDGSAAGTRPLIGGTSTPTGTGNSNPTNFAFVGSQTVFTASTPQTGWERYTATISAGSALPAPESVPGNAPLSDVPTLVSAGGRLFSSFVRPVTVGDVTLNLQTLAATADPAALGDILYTVPNAQSQIRHLSALGTRALFAARPADNDPTLDTLWISDGTASGTYPVVPPGPGRPTFIATTPVEWNGRAYFYARREGDSVFGIWSTDGTAGGTIFLAAIPNTTGFASPIFVPSSNRLFFNAFDASEVARLWSSDGSSAGTRVVDATVELENWSAFVINDIAYVNGSRANNDADLWMVNADASALVPGVVVGAANTTPTLNGFTSASTPQGPLAFFPAGVDAAGTELWVTDGTQSGTRRITDLWPGRLGSSPAGLVPVDGGIAFVARSPVTGNELWFSDGTESGTTLLADIAPGLSSSHPSSLQYRNGNLTFSAYRQDVGREPWTLLLRPCAADFNRNGFVDSQDFFEFVLAFFALEPSADFNADGVINSQDTFDFLAAFFVPC